MNKSLILIGLFSLFSGCSMLGGGKTNIPEVKPVEVVSEVVNMGVKVQKARERIEQRIRIASA